MFIPQISLKEELDKKLNHIDIYSFYLNKKITKLPISFNSPLRKDDNPSFGLFVKNNKVLWKDFTLNEGGDVYKLIQKLYGLNFYKVLIKIKKDLIDNKQVKTQNNISLIENIRNIYIQPYFYKPDNIPQSYYDYWNQYKVITPKILINNNVKAIKYAFINYSMNYKYKDDNIIIGYNWKYKNKIYHKLYFPLTSNKKFMSDFRGVSRYLIHNLNRINKIANYIIITKSVKDNMVFEGLGYNAISIQNEGIIIPDKIIEYLNIYYKRIYVFYDNDYDKQKNWGQLAAKKLISEHPHLLNRKIDGRYKVTDISDFIKKYDKEKTINILKQLIK